jgi:hypothetical protein
MQLSYDIPTKRVIGRVKNILDNSLTNQANLCCTIYIFIAKDNTFL